MRHSIAEGEAIQIAAIETLKEKGVEIHRWDKEALSVFEKAWNEVAEEASEKDEDFKKVWESLNSFREKYKIWKSLGYL